MYFQNVKTEDQIFGIFIFIPGLTGLVIEQLATDTACLQ